VTPIRIEYDPNVEALLLRGGDAATRRHPVFAGYLRQAKALFEVDGTIRISVSPEDLADRYRILGKLLSSIGAVLETGEYVSDALADVEIERKQFEKFSRQADEIWNGTVDAATFESFIRIVERECPGRTFYRKQLLSAYHLAFAQHACNFSVPGAGKTSIVYSSYAYLRSLPTTDEKSVQRLLIVGPLSSFKAWEDEYEEIFGKPSGAKRLSGASPATVRQEYLRGIAFGARDVEITLTSYATLANSEEDFRSFLHPAGPKTMMVLDEAHYIKSEDGYIASAALRLAPLASSRVVLTGTPAPNGYEDLSNLFKFIYPRRHVVGFPPASLRAMTDGMMPKAIPELKERIRPFFTRIRKADLNLPPMTENRILVEMGPAQNVIYRSLERQIVPQLRRDLNGPAGPVRVRARLIRLRQACTNPELLLRPIEDDSIFDTGGTYDLTVGEMDIADQIRNFDASQNLERLRETRRIVGEVLAAEGKVLVWSYFLGNLELLRLSLGDLAPFVEVLTGATPVANEDVEEARLEGTRERIIERFHSVQRPAILIANPQAVGESISLHKACRSAIYFDRDFNAGRFIQSKDRIHRYNPAGGEPVTYYYLVSSGTVDADIDNRLRLKERRLSDLVDSSDIPLLTSAMDGDGLDDIRAILDAYERRKTG
jgi:SNF2 family DNA or RNA helicase